MMYIWRNCIYQGKNIFRDKGFIFWEGLYPIILALFFYIAFNGIINYESESINIAIEDNKEITPILDTIDILKIIEIDKKDIAKNLQNGEIDAYIKSDLSLIVSNSGVKQTIVKSILDQVKQTMAFNEPIEKLDFKVDYLISQTQNANGMLIIFYSLIAMVSTYGVFSGIEATLISQANISSLGARITMSPTRKSTFLISGVLVGLFINIISNILLLFFIEFVLKLDLIKNIAHSSIFIVLGNFFGVSLGLFIGSSNKQSEGFKSMLSIAITLFLSFLSGLMSPDIKILIDENLPILNKVNPISIITNNLYRINLLENTSNLNIDIIILISYCLILISLSYIFLRRRQFDSI